MDPRIHALQKEAAERADVIGLAGGLPADELLPRDALARALAEVATSRDDALQYGWPEGAEPLRTWIAERLARRGAAIDPGRVIVTAGAQQALAIAARALEGTISVGAAAYPGALDAFRNASLQPVVQGGVHRYAMCGVSNPEGRDIDRAAMLAGDAEIVGDCAIIADEAYAELRFDGSVSRALLADAPDRVWHVGTISKTVAPGLRIGWLVPPHEQHDRALEIKQAADLHTASISQAAFVRMLALVDYEQLLDDARREYRRRAAALLDALAKHCPSLPVAMPDGGFSLWVPTDEGGDDVSLLEAALASGVMIDPGSSFRPAPSNEVAFRLSFSNLDPARFDEAARRLARALARWRRHDRAA